LTLWFESNLTTPKDELAGTIAKAGQKVGVEEVDYQARREE
jgi:hypothetical protein